MHNLYLKVASFKIYAQLGHIMDTYVCLAANKCILINPNELHVLLKRFRSIYASKHINDRFREWMLALSIKKQTRQKRIEWRGETSGYFRGQQRKWWPNSLQASS